MLTKWEDRMEELLSGAQGSTAQKKPNYLMPDGQAPTQDPLLPGIGGTPWQGGGTGSGGTGSAGGSGYSSETAQALEDALRRLAEGGSTATPTEGELLAAAQAAQQSSAALRENATQKGNSLYDAISAMAGKQDGRYDALIEQISEKGYRDFAGVGDILSYYAGQGSRAAGHAAAAYAAENGGNPDSYAAAQAARQRQDFANAGTEAALNYYNGQIDRWLAAVQAAGRDAEGLYGLMQENVDGTHKAASDEGARSESLFATLAGAESDRAAIDADRFSALLSHYKSKSSSGTGGASGSGSAGSTAGSATAGDGTGSISPMELDREYEQMLNPENGVYPKYSATDALIILWKKYPGMQDYLLQKYDKVLNPDYTFKE